MQSTGPLEGVTVIDLTHVLAGPYCTMILADLGARVIKIEHPDQGDDARQIGPFVKDRSAYFLSLNRGKQSIALDLKADADREIFESLLEGADIVVENFRPGSMERLGYGWEALHLRYPRLIYAAVSGFGHTGPYAQRPAYDMVVQAMGGIMSLTGAAQGEPTRVGTSVGDLSAGLFTSIGITTALYHRARTGEAQKIDVAMLDCQVAMLENAIACYRATGEVPGPIGSRHPSITPFGMFATRDGFIVITAGNDPLFVKLCKTLERAELPAREDFATNAARTKHETALKAELERSLRERDTSDWLARLEAAGVPCGPINDIAQVLEDPQIRARNMIVKTRDPEIGEFELAGNPIKLSAFPDPESRPPAPELDGSRRQILEELKRSRS